MMHLWDFRFRECSDITGKGEKVLREYGYSNSRRFLVGEGQSYKFAFFAIRNLSK
jgi:hypothetical protein